MTRQRRSFAAFVAAALVVATFVHRAPTEAVCDFVPNLHVSLLITEAFARSAISPTDDEDATHRQECTP